MRLFAVLLSVSSPAMAMETIQLNTEDTAAYRIVDYQAGASGSVIYTTRRIGFFGETYTRLSTTCDGSFMTLFLGSGKTYEEAARRSAVKGDVALLIGGTGDDAPRLACALIGTSRPKRDNNNR